MTTTTFRFLDLNNIGGPHLIVDGDGKATINGEEVTDPKALIAALTIAARQWKAWAEGLPSQQFEEVQLQMATAMAANINTTDKESEDWMIARGRGLSDEDARKEAGLPPLEKLDYSEA